MSRGREMLNRISLPWDFNFHFRDSTPNVPYTLVPAAQSTDLFSALVQTSLPLHQAKGNKSVV